MDNRPHISMYSFFSQTKRDRDRLAAIAPQIARLESLATRTAREQSELDRLRAEQRECDDRSQLYQPAIDAQTQCEYWTQMCISMTDSPEWVDMNKLERQAYLHRQAVFREFRINEYF